MSIYKLDKDIHIRLVVQRLLDINTQILTGARLKNWFVDSGPVDCFIAGIFGIKSEE